MEISKVGVLGCGLMGHGIAQICAQNGWDVVVREVDQDKLDKGLGKIGKQLDRAVSKGKMEESDADAVIARIQGTLDYGDLADCDLVIEVITEDFDKKKEMWGEVDGVVKDDAYFATNTSSLSVADQAAATDAAERFLGLHFFNPAQVMPLLEVVKAEGTSDDAYDLGSRSATSSARPPSRRATTGASSSTGSSSPTCSTRCAPTRRASARSPTSTPG